MNEKKEQVRTLLRHYADGVFNEERTLDELLRYLTIDVTPQNPLHKKKQGQSWVVPALDGSGHFVGTCVRPDSYSAVAKVGAFVEGRRLRNIQGIIKDNFELPYTSSTDPKDISPQSKFSLPSLAKLIIDTYGLNVTVDAFNGAMKNRSNYYLPYYYWPLKVLDWSGKVRFGNVSWRLQ